ncbi:TlpA family protein disulfide reductase [Algibacter pacificus]|uniref:TlpA family protein disulfide reductase n=1 Tax=Algibacter pacificus TaxID=2599389 RepID=UPI0011C89567|nr:TlpA disulfide reductase family protein [Algibacter pacificus]
MKKIFYALLSLITFISCEKQKPTINYAIVKGKLDGANSGAIMIANSLKKTYSYTLKINEDGSFLDTLDLVQGYYDFKYSNKKISLYLDKGFDLSITANTENIDSTFSTSGNGSIENNFIKYTDEHVKQFTGYENFYLLEESAFAKKMDALKSLKTNLVASNDELPSKFKTFQEKDIEYNYLYALNYYERFHKIYTKNPDFKVSDEFLASLKNIDYNNEKDYWLYKTYQYLVAKHYTKEAEKFSETESVPKDIAALITYAKIPSESIKNNLSKKGATFAITITKHLDDYYNAFKKANTDKEQLKIIEEYYKKLKQVEPGNPSPKFYNYENYNGDTTSLEDLKGKYVYIDVWATWCAPCRKETPFLKKIEKKYHNKNIHFVSISLDKPQNHKKWKNMIKEEALGGIQLIADNNFQSDFIKDYIIKGIPKFILLDPKGNIVDNNAPRPSDEKLIELFNTLQI